MNVLLISARRSVYTGEGNSAPHQGLLSIASVLREGTYAPTSCVKIQIIDDQITVIDRPWAPPGACLPEHAPDIIGVQVTTSSLGNGLKLLREARARFPKALAVIGGVGADAVAERCVAAGNADVVVFGEGEVSFSKLVHAFGEMNVSGFSDVPGIVWRRDDGTVIRNSPPSAIQDLDCLPMPARDLVDMHRYKKISRGRAGNLITSRGCSFACAYCYSRHHWGQGQRMHSVRRIISEVRHMYETYGIDRIRVEDDDFLENGPWVEQFCTELIESGLSECIEWEMKARPDLIEPANVDLLRRAGCFRILMGVETLNEDVLKGLGRGVKKDRVQAAIQILRKGGIGIQATVILGIPGETISSMRGTLEWLEKTLGDNSHDIVSPCFFVPFTPNVTTAMNLRYPFHLEVQDVDCFTGHIPVTSSDTCSYQELNRLYNDMAPTRKGVFPRIAHLATTDDVRGRLFETNEEQLINNGEGGARW